MLLICKQIFKLFNWFVKCFKGIFESIWTDSSETVNGYPFEDIELACHAFDSLYLLYTNLKRSFYRYATSSIFSLTFFKQTGKSYTWAPRETNFALKAYKNIILVEMTLIKRAICTFEILPSKNIKNVSAIMCSSRKYPYPTTEGISPRIPPPPWIFHICEELMTHPPALYPSRISTV